MYLLDTNIWLERLLGQQRSDEVGGLLGRVSCDRLFMTDFTFHSIGIILLRQKRTEAYLRFVADTLIDGGVGLVGLSPQDSRGLVDVMTRFPLDFDDAYQYLAAETFGLTVVSFDADFDRTERGRVTPGQVA